MAPYGPDWGIGQGKEPQIPSNDPLGVPDRHHLEQLDLALELIVRPPYRQHVGLVDPSGRPVLLGFADILGGRPPSPTVS